MTRDDLKYLTGNEKSLITEYLKMLLEENQKSIEKCKRCNLIEKIRLKRIKEYLEWQINKLNKKNWI